MWRDPRTVIGGSDAGAHLDMMCGAIYSTALLAHGVREFGVVSLEEAVHQLSDVPARLYGLRDRGRIADGGVADAVALRPRATSATRPSASATTFPAARGACYAEATGVEQVLVEGVTVVDDGDFTGATPGTLLRAGRDTRTVTP